MGRITRTRRAQIQREAERIRIRGQRVGWPIERIVTALCTAMPELTALEAWRLGLGWSRAQVISQVADLYVAEGLQPPGLSPEQLCRFEHGPDRPGAEYAEMLSRAYGARLDQLGLAMRCLCGQSRERYGQPLQAPWAPVLIPGELMTTANGLPAVRESLRLALLDAPQGSPAVVELAEAAVEYYALNYSRHALGPLFDEVSATRSLMRDALSASADSVVHGELRRAAGWLSALLGNLAFHLADRSGARAHLVVASAYGERVGDARLLAWVYGARSMVARSRGDRTDALSSAERAVAEAPTALARAQAYGWAMLPSLAQLGDAARAEGALGEAVAALGADPGGEAPGRFGFDAAELALHEAEAWLALGRHERAGARAESSAGECVVGSPGWAAATLVLALAEGPSEPGDAAGRAMDVLDRVPADRLRSTSRERLRSLVAVLDRPDSAVVRDLHERVRILPPPGDGHGRGTTA